MFLRQITDSTLAQNAYLIGCQRTGEALIVDPERDIDRYLKIAGDHDLRITAVAETHIHADYLSGSREFLERGGALVYLPAGGGPDWQFEWGKGHPKARFIQDGDTFRIGNIHFRALHTAGHTPEHMSYLVTDEGNGANEPMGLLSGDFLFVGGVGRPDLLESAAGQAGAMEPAARTLYQSLRGTRTLPEYLQILPAHGAGSACGKALGAVPVSAMGYERRFNPALRLALEGSEEAFVADILSGQPEPPLYFARMKRDNRSGPPLLPGGALPRPRRLRVEELPELQSRGGGLAILDLRDDRREFMRRHLRGSLLAPLAAGKLPVVAGSYVTEDASILLVANDESEVGEAVRQLARIGLDRVEAWIPWSEAATAPEGESGVIASLPRISTADLAGELTAYPGAVVLDVRGAGEYAEAHVRGARHIAYTRLAARLAEVETGQPVYVHCGSGLRAGFAVSFLARAGRKVVYVDGAFSDIPGSLLEPPAR